MPPPARGAPVSRFAVLRLRSASKKEKPPQSPRRAGQGEAPQRPGRGRRGVKRGTIRGASWEKECRDYWGSCVNESLPSRLCGRKHGSASQASSAQSEAEVEIGGAGSGANVGSVVVAGMRGGVGLTGALVEATSRVAFQYGVDVSAIQPLALRGRCRSCYPPVKGGGASVRSILTHECSDFPTLCPGTKPD